MLSQARKHALIYLYDIEEDLNSHPLPFKSETLQSVLDDHGDLPGYFDFSIFKMYAFDFDGNIIAQTGPDKKTTKTLSAERIHELRSGRSHIGETIQYKIDSFGQPRPVTDVIVPLSFHGEILGGLELELDLQKTMFLVDRLGKQYDTTLVQIVTASSVAILLFVWLVIHRGLIRPVSILKNTTRALADGDLAVRSAWPPHDEIGQLGQSVNYMADNIEKLIDQQQQAYLQVLQALARALEARDPYTATHSTRVTRYALKLAKRLGLPKEERNILRQAALMHDLGKIGIPDAILNKTSQLNEEEIEIMRTHPAKTAKILGPIKHLRKHREIAAWHHERWDGRGYPDRLRGEEIPLMVRIVSIADSWDAITGDRVYRKGMSFTEAVSILEEERDNGQFEPRLLDEFVAMIREDLHIQNSLIQERKKPSENIRHFPDRAALSIKK